MKKSKISRRKNVGALFMAPEYKGNSINRTPTKCEIKVTTPLPKKFNESIRREIEEIRK